MGLELRKVSKKFGDVVALSDVSVTVGTAEYVVILGPTGAGKTTMLRVIAGLEDPDSGDILIDGKRANVLGPEERGVVYLSQTYSLFPHMNVWKNTEFGPDVRDWDPKDKERLVTEMLNLVRLQDRTAAYPSELSGGMRQRNALARALSTNVRTLLLDEPLRALDARLRLNLRTELRKMSTDLGITSLHVTHDQEEAITIADKIVVLRKGEIIQMGSPEEIFNNPVSPFVMHFVGEANFFTGRISSKENGGTVLKCDGLAVHARPTGLPTGSDVCVGIKTEECSIHPGRKEGENSLTGRLERILFLGRLTSLEISSEYGDLKAKIPSRISATLKEGDEVTLQFGKNQAIVFPLPEDGLEKELEVE
ncbi:MAG: ABC transporter ATP-binding protein [Methanomassiliicoccales archaeon]|nr:MAG: ABC transporter ATP-binding protein [Methanomassiliicoccales archaeon]